MARRARDPAAPRTAAARGSTAPFTRAIHICRPRRSRPLATGPYHDLLPLRKPLLRPPHLPCPALSPQVRPLADHERTRNLERELAYISADLLQMIADGTVSAAAAAAVSSDGVDAMAAALTEYTRGCERLGAEQARARNAGVPRSQFDRRAGRGQRGAWLAAAAAVADITLFSRAHPAPIARSA